MGLAPNLCKIGAARARSSYMRPPDRAQNREIRVNPVQRFEHCLNLGAPAPDVRVVSTEEQNPRDAYWASAASSLAASMSAPVGDPDPALDEQQAPASHSGLRHTLSGLLALGLAAGLLVQQNLHGWTVAIFTLPIALLWIAEHRYFNRSRRNVVELRRRNKQLEVVRERLESSVVERQQLLERAHTSYLRTITTLARAVQARDPYAAGRCERVTRIAQRLAEELGFDADARHAIAVGVICADIGKIGIPDRLLENRGQLSERDYQFLRSYPEISGFILNDLELPVLVKEMARSHLERWDGRGGPDGLAGEDIPLSARILAVADALDHKTADGPGRPALPLDLALSEFEMETGSRFCPNVVEAMRRCLATDPALRSYFGGSMSPEGEPQAA
jgi:HD-GYP domain-containing protein (c-di-GMP phosphodiesterase class II)